MATWDDVRRLALALPETAERPSYEGLPAWRVNDKAFAWDRPLRGKDRDVLGDAAPSGPVLGVSVADEGVKQALVADDPAVYFTTPHFDGYAAVLVRLDDIAADELGELLTEAWLCRAPKRLVRVFRR
ncbi:MmcQ/YjbR family DNA-binding protein [Saccharothrix longispora]|uniref:MmcQ/YjbR family DNA-binding protein n=1 Tax=Saccharothrix longispora TaxID=33920 RepID=UPI0028FD8FD7|nr:MmcQ/YjbR family DNA-binding protein [Saccharothrix longispora]MBY8850957.1 MmcQ/YjbR family DNA-binding protein [Saccharothrix sp. MB29]MDU0293171.1 MmcQ/YjbR family DNA-binding protein [Saccharothrix longispora]